jgi:hypothetical protein
MTHFIKQIAGAAFLLCFQAGLISAQTDSTHCSSCRWGLGITEGGNYSTQTTVRSSNGNGGRTFALPGYESGISFLFRATKHWTISGGFNYLVYRSAQPQSYLYGGMLYVDYMPYMPSQINLLSSFVTMPMYLNRSFGTEKLKLKVGLGVEPAMEFKNRISYPGGYEPPSYDYTKYAYLFAGAKFGVDIRLCRKLYLVLEEQLRISAASKQDQDNSIYYKSIGLNAGLHFYPCGH